MSKGKIKLKVKRPRCHNCKHGSKQFKVNDLTHLHCLHPKYKEEDFKNGKLSAWDTLVVFSDSCSNHEFKEKTK